MSFGLYIIIAAVLIAAPLSANANFVAGRNCSCVAFRLDDIQDYWITAPQQAIIDVFKSTLTPISIGVIAKDFGEDTNMVGYVQQALSYARNNNWDLEIASHGWAHEDFSTFSLPNQVKLLNQSRVKISSVLGTPYTQVFIPPFNAFNANTITALKSLNYTVMTSQTDMDLPPYPLSGESFYRFPILASTSDNEIEANSGLYVGVPYTKTMTDIQTSLGSYGFAAVMMHPQEFSVYRNGEPSNTVNTTMINQLRLLIQAVQQAGLRIVPLGKIGTDSATSGSSSSSSTTGTQPPATTGPRTTGTTGTTGVRTTGTTGTTGIRTTGTTGTTGVRTTGTTGTTGSRSTTGTQPPATTGAQPQATTGAIVTTGNQAPATTGASATAPVVAFRLIQVQDYWLGAGVEAVMDIFKAHSLPLTLGVIAHIFGDDTDQVNAVKAGMARQPIEIACNGYNFEDFTKKTLAQQKTLMTNSRTAINNVLGVIPKVFIPPYNTINANTKTAATATGFTHLSATVENDPAPYSTGNPWRFPANAFTYNINNYRYFEGVSHTTTYQQIVNQVAANGFAVVEMTPGDYIAKTSSGDYLDRTTNQTMLNELTLLLQTVKSNGYNVVLISQIQQFSATTGLTGGASPLNSGDHEESAPNKTNDTSTSTVLQIVVPLLAGLVVIAAVAAAIIKYKRKQTKQSNVEMVESPPM